MLDRQGHGLTHAVAIPPQSRYRVLCELHRLSGDGYLGLLFVLLGDKLTLERARYLLTGKTDHEERVERSSKVHNWGRKAIGSRRPG